MKNKVRFHPERWNDYYLNWLENVRDWCISRQIAWGHRIPVWYCRSCGELTVSEDELKKCETCNSEDIYQDNDVLDTWFSSALWPFSTLGWPDETADLNFYYPTSTLVTDRGIIYFWVARMVMMGLSMLKEVPFSDVYIHGTILDEQGRKMSKSLGNGIDPIEMIETYGADAVRFALAYLTTEGQDIKLSPSQFEMGRNYINKVWNASRFALMNLEGSETIEPITDIDNLDFYDRWIISRLHTTIADATSSLDRFKYSDYAGTCYDFFWHELCDWYLEIAKLRMDAEGSNARNVLYTVLVTIFKLMHPMIPFVTEELWNTLNSVAGITPDNNDMSFSAWPESSDEMISQELHTEMETVKGMIRSIRNTRATVNIPPSVEIPAVISMQNAEARTRFEKHADIIKKLARVKDLEFVLNMDRPKNTAVDILGEINIYIPLEGFINIEDEKAKLQGKLDKKQAFLDKTNSKLQNESFIQNAPQEIVSREWELQRGLLAEIDQIKAFLENLV